MAVSFARLAAGFLATIIVGVPLGLAIGTSPVVKGLADPLIEFYRPIPSLAYLSLLIIWFGIGETSKVLVLLLAALPAVVLTTVAGVRSVRIERIQGAQSLGVHGLDLFCFVIVPSCLPDILTGVRVSFGLAYSAIVAAEILASTSGIGWMVWDATQYAESTVVIIGILIMGGTGLFVNRLLFQLQHRIVPWTGQG